MGANLYAGKPQPPPPPPTPTRIAYWAWAGSNRNGSYQLFSIYTNGTGALQLTTIASGPNEMPSWSPDGRRICFVSFRDVGWRIYTMNADGTDQVRLTQVQNSDDRSPDWSPLGDKIAYGRYNYDDHSGDGIYVMDLDTAEEQRLTVAPESVGGQGSPSWSPDGEFIVFHWPQGTPPGLYVIPADGSAEPTFLTSGSMPDWSPTGSAIAYTGSGYICYVGVWLNPSTGVWETVGAPVQVTTTYDGPWTYHPTWSSSGTSLTYTTRVYDKTGKLVQHAVTTDLTTTPFTQRDLGVEGLCPDWSPVLP
jgi:Tol biopolymer transport system component